MARARFEKIDEIQNDAIKLMLKREKGRNGIGHIPGNRKRQPTERDQISQCAAHRGIDRCAIHFANDEIVVCDLDGIWKTDWRDLYRPID